MRYQRTIFTFVAASVLIGCSTAKDTDVVAVEANTIVKVTTTSTSTTTTSTAPPETTTTTLPFQIGVKVPYSDPQAAAVIDNELRPLVRQWFISKWQQGQVVPYSQMDWSLGNQLLKDHTDPIFAGPVAASIDQYSAGAFVNDNGACQDLRGGTWLKTAYHAGLQGNSSAVITPGDPGTLLKTARWAIVNDAAYPRLDSRVSFTSEQLAASADLSVVMEFVFGDDSRLVQVCKQHWENSGDGWKMTAPILSIDDAYPTAQVHLITPSGTVSNDQLFITDTRTLAPGIEAVAIFQPLLDLYKAPINENQPTTVATQPAGDAVPTTSIT